MAKSHSTGYRRLFGVPANRCTMQRLGMSQVAYPTWEPQANRMSVYPSSGMGMGTERKERGPVCGRPYAIRNW